MSQINVTVRVKTENGERKAEERTINLKSFERMDQGHFSHSFQCYPTLVTLKGESERLVVLASRDAIFQAILKVATSHKPQTVPSNATVAEKPLAPVADAPAGWGEVDTATEDDNDAE